ncbi:hypothetical protein [Pyrococcus kukulkanii]|uniref:hypothetical protein n=1 Tax=Pyrococcus kukulkanii TaxID=1609559 RepID=UPI003564F5CF
MKTDLSEEELWDKIQEVLQELDEDWTYDDIIEKLHEKGHIEYVENYRVYEYELCPPKASSPQRGDSSFFSILYS